MVHSLFEAMARVDGEALVMNTGEKPYVIAPAGRVELSARGLTNDTLKVIVSSLLPVELQTALRDMGSAQYEVPPQPDCPGERFTILASQLGDGVWIEIRRHRAAAPAASRS